MNNAKEGNLLPFPLTLSHPAYADERKQITKAFKLSCQYLDNNFTKELCQEAMFISRLWKLFICNTLVQSEIGDYCRSTNGKGPDFHLISFLNGKDLYIECVCRQRPDACKINLIKNNNFMTF